MSQPPVTMYASNWCPYCTRARELMLKKGLSFHEIDVDDAAGTRAEMIERSGRRTVPQIFVGDRHIGGCDDLAALDDSGELDRLIQGV